MILNIIFLAIISYLINNAIQKKLTDKEVNKYILITINIGVLTAVGLSFLGSAESVSMIAVPVIVVFTIHILNVIKLLNSK